MMPRTAHMAIATNSGSLPIHSLHHRPAALRFCDSFFPHCGNTVDSHGHTTFNKSRNPDNRSRRNKTHCHDPKHHCHRIVPHCRSIVPHCGNTVDSHGNDPTNNSRNPGNSRRGRTHCGFSWDCCVMPSDGSSDSSAMLPPLEPSLQMIPWYPAIGPESETPVDASRGNRCGTQAAHSPEPAQPTGTLRTTNPSICRHASVTCPGRRRAWLRNDAPRCLFRNATPLLVLQFQQFVGECRRGYAGTYPSKAADYGQ